MSELRCATDMPPIKWYNLPRFPLLPQIKVRSANQYNTWSFSFRWLAIAVWTMDNPAIGFQVELDDHCLQLRGRVPFLIFGLFVPVFPMNYSNRFWRKVRRT